MKHVEWEPPIGQVTKLKVDGACFASEHCIDIGVVARDEVGLVLCGAAQAIRGPLTPELLEERAFTLALKLAKERGMIHLPAPKGWTKTYLS